MKICVISTTVISCPPSGYAGLEMVSWLCANGLKAKGHEVMLVAPKERLANISTTGLQQV